MYRKGNTEENRSEMLEIKTTVSQIKNSGKSQQ